MSASRCRCGCTTRSNVVQLSSDGKRMLTAAANGVEVWDAATGKRIGEALAHEEAVTHAAFSPDGKPC